MALEDAATLAECLERVSLAGIPEALKAFPVGLRGCYERSLLYLVHNRTKHECELARKIFSLVAGSIKK